MIRQPLNGFLSLFFPLLCKGCGNPIPKPAMVLCRRCRSRLPRTGFEQSLTNPVMQTFWGRVPLEFASALFYYRKGELLPTLIHQLKYKRCQENGAFLGTLAGQILKSPTRYASIDAIVPVPLHPRKEKLRGYNQCSLLGQGLSSVTGWPLLDHAVVRLIHTQSQTRRSRYERWQNVEGIFGVLSPDGLVGKHVLVVDDVVTTGSTLEACCRALLQVPGVRVSVLTIGYAVD